MTVYILIAETDYEPSRVLAVYSSLLSANEAKDKLNSEAFQTFVIKEFELDKDHEGPTYP